MDEDKAMVASMCFLGRREEEIRLFEQTCVSGGSNFALSVGKGGRHHPKYNDAQCLSA
jgi:hypothetical protein